MSGKQKQNWKFKTVGELFELRNGINFSKAQKNTGNGIPTVDVKNMYSETLTIDKSRLYRVDAKVDKSRLLNEDDILFVRSSVKRAGVGWPSLVGRVNEPSTFCGFLIRGRLRTDDMNPKFVVYFLRQQKVRDQMVSRSGTSTLTNISQERLSGLSIPVPTKHEQDRIVRILDKSTAVRRSINAFDQRTKQFSGSLYRDWFGHPANAKETTALGDCVSVVSGGTPSKQNSEYWNGNFPWVSPKDMKVNYVTKAIDHVSDLAFEETTLKKIPTKSILIVIRGMILAHTIPVALTEVPVAINQDMKALIPKEGFDPLFILWTLKSAHNYILSKVATAAHGTKRLEVKHLLEFPIPKVSYKRQQEFAKVIDRLRAIRTRHASIDPNDLFDSLVQRAFKGEL